MKDDPRKSGKEEPWKIEMEEIARKKLGIKGERQAVKTPPTLRTDSICDFVVMDLFTPEECDKILEYCEKTVKMGPATLNKGGRISEDIRRSKVGWLPRTDETFWWAQDRIKDAVLTINEKKYKFDTTHAEQIQFTQYGCGDHYTWHHDLGEHHPLNKRKLTISVELSDGSTFDGGNLMLLTLGNGYHTIERKQGQAVIFPSYLPHIVTEVKPKPGSN